MRSSLARILLCCALMLCGVISPARADALHELGIEPGYLDPEFWEQRLEDADRPRLDAQTIASMNEAMRDKDPSFHRLEELPEKIAAGELRQRVIAISAPLPDERFDQNDRKLTSSQRRKLQRSLALGRIEEYTAPQFGLIVRRTSLRSYPTQLRVFSRPGDHDIDRFQESALFPGDAVAVLHRSYDRLWCFLVSERYAAWAQCDVIAFADRDLVLSYGQRRPALTVIGKSAHTVFTPDAPALSALTLDMGVRLPLRTDWPSNAAVNGQLPLAAWVIELPQRDAEGRLRLAPALIARGEPVATAPLPFTSTQIIRQAFRFLGERYGWGHDYQARDCSGFVSEVYRSMGIQLPRNTRDQALSTVFDRIDLTAIADPSERARTLASIAVGDLIYVPGHVMMAIGRIDAELWLIHDVHGVQVRDHAGTLHRLPLNGVSVTPLSPLMADANTALSDRITHIQRIRPGTPR